MTYEKKQEQAKFIRALIQRLTVSHPANEQEQSGHATDEEVRDFIRLFMRFSLAYNHHYSSYSLKHIAESAIGSIFRGSSPNSCYVSNDQFKRIMHEDEFRTKYKIKPADPQSINERYSFRWVTGAESVFMAFGVHAC